MAYFAALLSSLAMGTVYLTDMAMAGRTYNRPSQPMFLSSLFCMIPGIVLSLLIDWDNPPPMDAALMSLASGAILMLANWLYFSVIYSDPGDCTELACFETASVMVIAFVTLVLGVLGFVHHDTIQNSQWIGIALGASGLVAVHLYGDKLTFVTLKHRIMLMGFMLFGASYEMLIDRSIYLASLNLAEAPNPEQAGFLQMSPFFWFGLATGVVAIVPKQERDAFQENLPNLFSYWWAVLLAEVCALVAFGAMVLGFAEGHVAVISLLTGTFPVIVIVGGVVLRRKFGFDSETFPEIQHPWKKTVAVTLVILGASFASWI